MEASLMEWECRLSKDEAGRVFAYLVEVEADGSIFWVADAEFGPFDTALDVTRWLVKAWAPRAKLPLR